MTTPANPRDRERSAAIRAAIEANPGETNRDVALRLAASGVAATTDHVRRVRQHHRLPNPRPPQKPRQADAIRAAITGHPDLEPTALTRLLREQGLDVTVFAVQSQWYRAGHRSAQRPSRSREIAEVVAEHPTATNAEVTQILLQRGITLAVGTVYHWRATRGINPARRRQGAQTKERVPAPSRLRAAEVRRIVALHPEKKLEELRSILEQAGISITKQAIHRHRAMLRAEAGE